MSPSASATFTVTPCGFEGRFPERGRSELIESGLIENVNSVNSFWGFTLGDLRKIRKLCVLLFVSRS